MITKTALVIALTLGTVGVASAIEFDANTQNRYPQATQTFQTRNVALTSGHAASVSHGWSIPASSIDAGGR